MGKLVGFFDWRKIGTIKEIRNLLLVILLGLAFALFLWWGVENEIAQFDAGSSYTKGVVESYGYKWLRVGYLVDGVHFTAMKGSSGVPEEIKNLVQEGDTIRIQYVTNNPGLARVLVGSWRDFQK